MECLRNDSRRGYAGTRRSTWCRVVRPMFVSGALALALSIGAGGSASGQSADRQAVSDRFTTTLPNSSTGRMFAADFFDPGDRAAKPPVARKVVIELHPGSRWDTYAVPQCKATDAELVLLGSRACPAESRVGQNEVLVDHGFPQPARFTTSDVTLLNNANELILVSQIRGLLGVSRNVIRGKVNENSFEISAGFIPGTGPDGGARKRERATFPPRSSVINRVVRNYLTTPPICPESGFWVNRATYTYADGVVQTSTSRSPCVKKKRRCHKSKKRRFSLRKKRCAKGCGRAGVRKAGHARRCRSPRPGSGVIRRTH